MSADIFQLAGSNYLVMVDHYSDFFELDSLRNTTASMAIRAMKRNFARHGIPDECITDNGPQFDSYEYSSFAREYGFTMIKPSPYYSRANGKAESAVKIAKNILKKSRHEDPYLALLAYRNTPQQGYSYEDLTTSYLLLRADLFRRQRRQVWYSKTLQIGDEKQRRSTIRERRRLLESSRREKRYM